MQDTSPTNIPRFQNGNWLTPEVYQELTAINKLKAVEEAFVDGGYLYVRTKAWTLKHPGSLFPLRRMEIRIPLYRRGEPCFRYRTPLGLPHPVLKLLRKYRSSCIGEYSFEYERARPYGPLPTVLVLLGMLQTIMTGTGEVTRWREFDPRQIVNYFRVFFFVLFMIPVLSLVYHITSALVH